MQYGCLLSMLLRMWITVTIISDYFAIMEEFGTMEDWDAFRDGAHERGIAIIMDLVLNHSSDKT